MSKIVRSGDSYGVYRKEGKDVIFGESRLIYIKNGDYYLTELKVYADEMIDCWGLMDFEEFKKKLDEGWIRTSVPDKETVRIHLLSSFVVDEASCYISPEELIKEIKDTISRLNNKPNSLEVCRESYEKYLENKTIDNKKKLRKAYYAMPKHMRHFVLGDMQLKDSPITTIIDQIDIEEIEIKYPQGRDDKFIDLYTKVAKGTLPYFWAVIDIEAIKPFKDGETEIPESFRKRFLEKYTSGKPLPIHVYQENDTFIMSDDYMSFLLYKGLKVKSVPCLVLGEPKGEHVRDKMRVKFEPPTVIVEKD